jgi:hypothetical protein
MQKATRYLGRGLVLLATVAAVGTVRRAIAADDDPAGPDGDEVPVAEIERIVGAQGTLTNDVLDIGINRTDIGDLRGPPPHDKLPNRQVTLTPSFEINGDLTFQRLGHGQAFLNGDLPLREEEVNPFIAALLKNGLVFQAYHQHLPSYPQIWFVHFRGTGDPLTLARAIRHAIDVTSTPLPQTRPSNPTTPLDPQKLARILHGRADVGENGVVTVNVPRKDTIIVDGVRVNPFANIASNIQFKPMGGAQADVVPDFGLTAQEVDPVVHKMLIDQGWYQGCLYNQCQ